MAFSINFEFLKGYEHLWGEKGGHFLSMIHCVGIATHGFCFKSDDENSTVLLITDNSVERGVRHRLGHSQQSCKQFEHRESRS